MITIEINNLYKKYQKELYNGFSAQFTHEKINLITGSNGSGKSTLLNIIAGLTTNDAGKISYFKNNRQVNYSEIKSHMSLISPYLEPYKKMKLIELVRFSSHENKMIIENALSILEDFKLDTKQYYGSLSTGEKQKCKVALFFAKKPLLLLLDEPFVNLDVKSRDILNHMIVKLSEKTTILMATNNKSYIQQKYSEVPID